MSNIALDPRALQQLHSEQKTLLDTIDGLRVHGVGQFVDLPQIIVVGDQSSGKSSVLEAISMVRFPIKDGLCTRFATELVLRTSPRPRIDVQIQARSPENKVSHPFNVTSFDKDELPKIIEDAKRTMLQNGAGFTEDVLRVEICGPGIPHLTLVDLPGFYHSENENQSAAGRQIVERLAERYMSKKNSIILAIISARNQVILQKVLSKVKLHDRARERTLGIITKPDLLRPGSQDEEDFIRLAKNLDKSQELSWGWHVLRNRGENEAAVSDEERDAKEKEFFQRVPWSSVPSKNRGIEVLRRRLSDILLSHIKNNLQGLIGDIERNINDRQIRLKRLAEPRSSPRELRAYLDRIASQFQILSLNAVDGNYSHAFFGGLFATGMGLTDARIRKLRAMVKDLNRVFTYVMATKGSTETILPKGVTLEDDLEERGGASPQELPLYLSGLIVSYPVEEPRRILFEGAATKLEMRSSANQGNEFPGTSNDRLAVELFRHQSRPWGSIARTHVKVVLQTAQQFVEMLLSHIIGPDQKTCSAILNGIVDPFFESKQIALERKITEILHHYLHGNPQPLDAEFRKLLMSRHRKQVEKEVLLNLLKTKPEIFSEAGKEQLTDTSPLPASEFGAEELVDKAETYYEISLRTFTENMIVLVIENCLVEDIPNVFTTEKVSGMEDEELERLAAESEDIRIERSAVRTEYESLRKGLQLCNRYRERKAPVFAEIDTLPPGTPEEPVTTPEVPVTTPRPYDHPARKLATADRIRTPSSNNGNKPDKHRNLFDGRSSSSSSSASFNNTNPTAGLFASTTNFVNNGSNPFSYLLPTTAPSTKSTGGLFANIVPTKAESNPTAKIFHFNEKLPTSNGFKSPATPQATEGFLGNPNPATKP